MWRFFLANVNVNVNGHPPFKVIQRHRFWYQSKAHIRLPVSDLY